MKFQLQNLNTIILIRIYYENKLFHTFFNTASTEKTVKNIIIKNKNIEKKE